MRGREVTPLGFAGVPSIPIRMQARIGLSPPQLDVVVQLLDCWHDPEQRPFPTKREIADRIGITHQTVQTDIRALHQAGLVRREYRKTMGDRTRARAERQNVRRTPATPPHKTAGASP